MVNGIKIQIEDTGTNVKNGAISQFAKAVEGPQNIFARTVSPEIDFLFSKNESKRLDSAGDLTYAPNTSESMNAPRLNIQCVFPLTELTTLQNVIKMGSTQGLKRLTGGLGTLATLPGAETEGLYVIIRSFRIAERLTSGVDTVSVTMQFEVV